MYYSAVDVCMVTLVGVGSTWGVQQGPSCRGGRDLPASHLQGQLAQGDSFDKKIFCLGFSFSLFPEIFYIITQWSCSPSGSLWEKMDSNPGPLPRCLMRYQWATTSPMSLHISNEPPYLQWAFIYLQWASISPVSLHISSELPRLQWATTIVGHRYF